VFPDVPVDRNGSASDSYLLVRCRRPDSCKDFWRPLTLANEASGNIGETNVGTGAGLAAGVLTFAVDAGQGWFAVGLRTFQHGASGLLVAAGFFALLDIAFTPGCVFAEAKAWLPLREPLRVVPGGAVGGANSVRDCGLSFGQYVSLGSLAYAAAIPLLVMFYGQPHFAPPKFTVGSLATRHWLYFKPSRKISARLTAAEPNFPSAETGLKHEDTAIHVADGAGERSGDSVTRSRTSRRDYPCGCMTRSWGFVPRARKTTAYLPGQKTPRKCKSRLYMGPLP